jgi:glycerophosphoryl diester phosphodiesterase
MLLSLINDAGFQERVGFSSFQHENLVTLKKLQPSIPVYLLFNNDECEPVPDNFIELVRKYQASQVVFLTLDTRLFVQELARKITLQSSFSLI